MEHKATIIYHFVIERLQRYNFKINCQLFPLLSSDSYAETCLTFILTCARSQTLHNSIEEADCTKKKQFFLTFRTKKIMFVNLCQNTKKKPNELNKMDFHTKTVFLNLHLSCLSFNIRAVQGMR